MAAEIKRDSLKQKSELVAAMQNASYDEFKRRLQCNMEALVISIMAANI